MPTTPSKTATSQTNEQLADLWVLHHDPVRTYLIARAGRGADHALIDDAIASTIEILIHRLRHGGPIASIGGWLRVVSWHEYLRLIRSHRHRRLDRLPIDTLTDLGDATEDLPAALGRREAARDLKNASCDSRSSTSSSWRAATNATAMSRASLNHQERRASISIVRGHVAPDWPATRGREVLVPFRALGCATIRGVFRTRQSAALRHRWTRRSSALSTCALAIGLLSLGPLVSDTTASADTNPSRGPSCGLDLVEDGTGGTIYLVPITGRKNIGCADAQKVFAAARELFPDNRLYCAKKSRYRKWTVRHVGRSSESLSARFTKGSQQFRIDGQGS